MSKMEDVSPEEMEQLKSGQIQNDIGLDQVVREQQEKQKVEEQPVANTNAFTDANYFEIKGLPSKCRFYPKNVQILGRRLKVLEIKKVAQITDDNGDFVVLDVLRNATKVIGMNFEDLFVADKMYMIFWLRANSYLDPKFIINFICPSCDKKSDFHFECDDMDVQYVADDYDPNNPITLPSGTKITYRYLTINDELAVDRFKEINSNAVMTMDDELLGLAKMITTVNGEDRRLIEKYQWLVDIDPNDYAYIKTYLEKKGMGISPVVKCNCSHCGGNVPIGISFRPEFFIPEYKFE